MAPFCNLGEPSLYCWCLHQKSKRRYNCAVLFFSFYTNCHNYFKAIWSHFCSLTVHIVQYSYSNISNNNHTLSGFRKGTLWGNLSKQTRLNMNAGFTRVMVLSLEVCRLNNHSDLVWRGGVAPFEVPLTYQSRSSGASCHPDLTLSHILTCGTLLWKERKEKKDI